MSGSKDLRERMAALSQAGGGSPVGMNFHAAAAAIDSGAGDSPYHQQLKANVAAAKAATERAAKNAAAEQSEKKTEKAAGDKMTKQEVAVQVRYGFGRSVPSPG